MPNHCKFSLISFSSSFWCMLVAISISIILFSKQPGYSSLPVFSRGSWKDLFLLCNLTVFSVVSMTPGWYLLPILHLSNLYSFHASMIFLNLLIKENFLRNIVQTSIFFSSKKNSSSNFPNLVLFRATFSQSQSTLQSGHYVEFTSCSQWLSDSLFLLPVLHYFLSLSLT